MRCTRPKLFVKAPLNFNRPASVVMCDTVVVAGAVVVAVKTVVDSVVPGHKPTTRVCAGTSGAARGEGKASPYGWTSKNYVIYVCFHCHGTSSYHTTNTLQGRRAKSHVDTQTIQPGLGDFVL